MIWSSKMSRNLLKLILRANNSIKFSWYLIVLNSTEMAIFLEPQVQIWWGFELLEEWSIQSNIKLDIIKFILILLDCITCSLHVLLNPLILWIIVGYVCTRRAESQQNAKLVFVIHLHPTYTQPTHGGHTLGRFSICSCVFVLYLHWSITQL